MRFRAGFTGLLSALAGLGVAGIVIMGISVWRGPAETFETRVGSLDREVAVDITPDEPLRLTVFGTSLSGTRYDWPEALEQSLTECLGRPVEIARVTRAGANLTWARSQLAQVQATQPHLVLMEFAINDADLRDGLSLTQGRAELQALTRQIRDSGPGVVLLTMNPARGLRGVMRPRLSAHYGGVRAVAANLGTGLIDLEARWRAMPRADRGLQDDGLHPDPAVARAVIVPVIETYVIDLLGGCV